MFIGHYAVGLAAKRVAPRAPLWILLAAPQVLDLLWPLFVLAGIESFRIDPGNTAFTPLAFDWYPWSHSLLMSCAWGVALAAIAWLATRDRAATAVAFALVVSHWVLDWITHRADLPLVPGGARFGLGLWNHVAATMTIELLMFAGGAAVYWRTTRAVDRTGRWVLVALFVFLLVVWLANVLGPPPPSTNAVAVSALALWLIPLWGVWIDRHRALA